MYSISGILILEYENVLPEYKCMIKVYTVVAIEVCTLAFWPIKHSILELFSRFLVCMYSFYIQKWGTKNMSKIGHSCQVPKMA